MAGTELHGRADMMVDDEGRVIALLAVYSIRWKPRTFSPGAGV